MQKTIQSSEYCTVGHPDRTCDYIASYLLDKYLEQDPLSRVALEVQLKDQYCTVSGEVTSRADIGEETIANLCREAMNKIGYTAEYQAKYGKENVVYGDELEVATHISRQSWDIAQGVDRDAPGDQGIFWGLAVDEPLMGHLPKDYHLARKLGQDIAGKFGGLDVKTLVTVGDCKPVECFVAIPLAPSESESDVEATAKMLLGDDCKVIVNGTGRYVTHGSVGDCGTTGRKLVVDFYGGNSRIGGGSPWGKDPTKADVTLNVYARWKALVFMKNHGLELVRCAISCCIGQREIRLSFFDKRGELIGYETEDLPMSHIVETLGLNKPVYAKMCKRGLFGYEEMR